MGGDGLDLCFGSGLRAMGAFRNGGKQMRPPSSAPFGEQDKSRDAKDICKGARLCQPVWKPYDRQAKEGPMSLAMPRRSFPLVAVYFFVAPGRFLSIVGAFGPPPFMAFGWDHAGYRIITPP